MASTATISDAEQAPAPEQGTAASAFRHAQGRVGDAIAVAGFLLTAIYVQIQVFPKLNYSFAHPSDPYFFEWMFAHAARCVTHLENPFFTDRLGAPEGVNILANTSVLGIGIPLTPVTLLFGAHTTFLIAITAGLAGTAASWYWLLSRHIVDNKIAAALGAMVCGFGPAVISHAHGHVNFISQFLVPIIIWRFLKLTEPDHTVRNGLIFGLVTVYQLFIGEEVLFFTGLSCAVFAPAYLFTRQTGTPLARLTSAETITALRNFGKSFAVAAAVAAPLLAYPLYMQFLGPQAYHGIPEFVTAWGADLASYPAFARESIAGDPRITQDLAPNESEENTFFGFPLLLVLLGIIVWQRRNPVIQALTVTGLVFLVLSLGPRLLISGEQTNIPLPWLALQKLPLFNSVLPARLGLVVWPVAAVMLAIAANAAFKARVRTKVLWAAALACALLPVAPTPLVHYPQPETPKFFASGHWRDYLAEDRTLTTIPFPSPNDHTMRWAAEDQLDFRIPRGYFLGPEPGTKNGIWGAPGRPTSSLIDKISYRGKGRQITDKQRRQAKEDFEYWETGLVVLPSHPHERILLTTMEQLIGPATRVDDVWIWQLPTPK